MALKTSKAWAHKICAAWQRSINSIFECGRLLIAAKQKLKHGQFQKMLEAELPFGPSTAERLMTIARDTRLTNPAHAQLLPASWYTLYELSKLTDVEFQAALDDGTINPNMQRNDIPDTSVASPTFRVTYEDAQIAAPYTVSEPEPLSLAEKAAVVVEAVPDTPVTLPDPTEGWGPAWVVLESLARLADVRVADRVIEIVRENATDAWVSGARDAIANIARVEAALLGRRH